MIGTLVYQLTRNLSIEDIKKGGFDAYFVDHTTGVYPASAAGVPFTAAYLQSKGDVITDLHENMAAEQKARTTYDNILRLVDDPDVRDVIKFLRQERLYTISDLVKDFALQPISLIVRTSMLSTLHLIRIVNKRELHPWYEGGVLCQHKNTFKK